MRQQRPTTLILAVSLALFANAALAQRAAVVGGVRAAGTMGTAPAASAPVMSAGTSNNVNVGNSVNANTQPPSSPTIVTTTSGGNLVALGAPASGAANLQARLIDANGNLLVDANGNALVTDGRNIVGIAPVATGFDAAVVGVDPNQVVVASTALPTSYTAVTATPQLDRATRKELTKERTASRTNRQLLTSIAPRTNVDRTDQMPDDPLPLRY